MQKAVLWQTGQKSNLSGASGWGVLTPARLYPGPLLPALQKQLKAIYRFLRTLDPVENLESEQAISPAQKLEYKTVHLVKKLLSNLGSFFVSA